MSIRRHQKKRLSDSASRAAAQKVPANRASFAKSATHAKTPLRHQKKDRIEFFESGTTMIEKSDGSVELNFFPSAPTKSLKARER
ncbi:MAG: hypothetical protein ACLPTZ_11095 [Beijerinckiaceae bacterium]|jgi:hypothetical protein